MGAHEQKKDQIKKQSPLAQLRS